MSISRRKFVADAGLAGAGLAIVPRHVLGNGFAAPSDRLNVAVVGVGGQGRANMINLASQNIVAMCDVDWNYADESLGRLDADVASRRRRLDATRDKPILDALGKPVPMLTALESARFIAQVDGMLLMQNEHLPRAQRYDDY